MTESEHLAIANRLQRLAERLRQEGDDVAMAEMLWGTANRVANAIAIQHELGSDNSLPRLRAVGTPPQQQSSNRIESAGRRTSRRTPGTATFTTATWNRTTSQNTLQTRKP